MKSFCYSDVVAKMPRLEILVIYSVCKCDTLLSVRYLMREENEGLEWVCKLLLGSTAKHLPPKQSEVEMLDMVQNY